MAKPWKTNALVVDRTGAMKTVALEVEINWQALADELGTRASKNKSGRSGLLAGLIKAKIVKGKA